MKKITLPFLILLCGVKLLAQQVNTFAGLPFIAGSTDGDRSMATFHNPHGIAVATGGVILLEKLHRMA